MANYLVTDTELTNVANSIREKGGTTASLSWPTGYVNAVNDIEVGGNAYAVISVSYPSGSTCTCTKGNTILTAEGTNGKYNFLVPENGSWVVSCTNGTDSDSQTANITTQYQIVNIILEYANPVLNNNTWAVISTMAQRGCGDTYWDIGDRKAIMLNGTVGTLTLNQTLYIFILDFNHPINKTIADNNIIFGGFKTALTGGVDVCLCDSKYNSSSISSTKYFNMNHWGYTNYGGWAACDLRYDILGATEKQPSVYEKNKTTSAIGYDATQAAINSPMTNTLMAALSSDMRAALRLWTRWVDNKGNSSNVDANVTAIVDAGISLLTEFEISGTSSSANTYEKNHQKQMAYYSAGNCKVKYKYNATSTTALWWGSSATYNNASTFCTVNTDSNINVSYANYSYGLAPAFKV